MVNGMATTKITITVPDAQLTEIRKRVAAREAASVSGFIQRAVQKSLDNEIEFRAMIDAGLRATGGPLSAKERAWAEEMLRSQVRASKKRKPA
jgi:Arc/MetJ-type ribon-helix-helix transcriptional regulator